MKTTINKEFFDKWKGKDVAMWCKKEEYAEEFCKIMHEQGLRWRGERSYLDENFWNIYTIQTSYDFNIRGYFSKDWGISNDYTILDFEDYIVKEKMTKQELVELMIENFMNKNGDLDLSHLDFSDFAGDVYIDEMEVGESLHQDFQKVGGDLFQGGQKVRGRLSEYY